jgi:site-specific DNA recombinase
MVDQEKIRYFLYARRSVAKSDKEEKVASIESQISEMKALAKSQNLKIVRIFQEAKSAKEPYVRTEFAEMIKQINAGKADGILVWKMDRLTRNSVDEGTVKYLLQKGILKNIKASDRDFYPDDNVLLASVEFGVAVQYSRDLAKHIKRGLRAKAQEGHRPNIAPIGYRNTKFQEKGKETVVVDDEKFPIVRKMFGLFLTGRYSVAEIERMAKVNLGLRTRGTSKHPPKPISKTAVFNILDNTFYTGEFEWPRGSGNWYIGKHKPMITMEEYNQVQRLLHERGHNTQPRNKKFTYTALIKCGICGASITAEEKFKHCKNGNVHHYVYYRCTRNVDPTCKDAPIREEDLEAQIYDIIKNVSIPKKIHEWLLGRLNQLEKVEEKDAYHIIQAQKKIVGDCQFRLDGLLNLRVSNEITSEDYARSKIILETEKITAESMIADLQNKEKSIVAEAKNQLTFASAVIETFKKADSDEKRHILKNIGLNYTLKDKKLSVAIRKPLSLLLDLKNDKSQKEAPLEPVKVL